MKSYRRAVRITAILLAVFLIFSCLAGAILSEHTCTGEHCTICLQVALLNLLFSGILLTAQVLFSLRVRHCQRKCFSSGRDRKHETPILLRTKLSD